MNMNVSGARSVLIGLLLPAKSPGVNPFAGGLGAKVSLNPQPLPPKESSLAAALGDKVSLNPQPLPPKPNPGGPVEGKVVFGRAQDTDDWYFPSTKFPHDPVGPVLAGAAKQLQSFGK